MLNQSALNVFYKNALTGIGFGMKSYRRLVGVIPHNIIYQSLAQGGLFYNCIDIIIVTNNKVFI